MMEMKRNAKLDDVRKALEEKKMDAGTVLSLIPIIRIRRLSSMMDVELPARIWRARKSEIIAAFVAGMAKEGTKKMEDTEKAALITAFRIASGWGKFGHVEDLAMWIHGNNHEPSIAAYEAVAKGATKDEKVALLMVELEKRLAKTCADPAAAMEKVETVAGEFVSCTETRSAQQWSYGTPEKDAAAEDYWKAESAFKALLNAIMEGKDLTEADRLNAIAAKIAATEIEGVALTAKPWKNYGKTRIYVTVTVGGERQTEELFLDLDKGGKAFWKTAPKKRPDWADAVFAAVEAAA
ncbi:MAG: hypothetical protein IJR14_07360 [Synergistaceae bacterium]|nr:hypothetical protein [Synergistaceae bacterium]